MIRPLELNDIEIVNKLINDKNYIINEYELKKKASVYIKNDQIVGFISYKILYERAELDYIFVQKEERKRGIASKLLLTMFDDCRNSNVESIDLEVNSLNEKAINLYQKFEFKMIGIRKKYYDGIDGLIMKREIR